MLLSQVKTALRVCRESKAGTLCLVGVSGSGKTSIFSQIYKELGYDAYVIMRPALLADSADLIGLPNFEIIEHKGVKIETTAFRRPKWLPLEGQKVLVVVDEINRATKDVSNALFGLIESEQPFIGEYKLPVGCHVVATCNPPTDNYGGVLDLSDNAWSSRLLFVKISPDLETYTEYGRKSKSVSKLMLDFLNKNQNFFGTSGDFEVDMFFNKENGKEETNTRSFSKASAIEAKCTELGVDDDTTFELIRGIKGLEFATAFMQFRNNYAKIVTLEQLISDANAHESFDYEALSDISKVLGDLTHAISQDTYTNEQLKNIIPFLNKIPLDTLKGFLMALINDDNNACKDSKTHTPFLNDLGESEVFAKCQMMIGD